MLTEMASCLRRSCSGGCATVTYSRMWKTSASSWRRTCQTAPSMRSTSSAPRISTCAMWFNKALQPCATSARLLIASRRIHSVGRIQGFGQMWAGSLRNYLMGKALYLDKSCDEYPHLKLIRGPQTQMRCMRYLTRSRAIHKAFLVTLQGKPRSV